MNRLRNLLQANAKRGEFRAEGNTLYVYDVIVASDMDAEWLGGTSAESFIKALRSMSGPVNVRVNSPGGDVFAGVAMSQAIRDYAEEVTVFVDGYAASAASLIAVSADKTVMGQGSFLMIHKAWTIAMGNADEFLAQAGVLEKIDGSLAEMYATKSGKSAEHYAPLLAAETWLTAKEAIAEGLADEISTSPKASAKWDLSAYEKAPEASAEIQLSGIADAIAEIGARQAEANDEIEQRTRQLTVRLLQQAA